MVAITETGREPRTDILLEDEEDHDGWGPIRPRRSSAPPDMHLDQELDTVPVICEPEPDDSAQER